MEGSQRSITNFSILGFSLIMLLLTMALYHQGEIGFDAMLICTVAMMGSFGPVVALSSLSNNLNQTLASGERVLSILEETPMVEEIPVRSEGAKLAFAGAAAENVSFAYEEEEILKNCSVNIEKGKIIGIHGASGSGKSTLLNMLAGLEKPTKGEVIISGEHIEKKNEEELVKFRRDNVGFIFQSFHLLGTMNAVENVALPLSFRGVPKDVRLKKADKMLDLVNLGKHKKHMPNQMSGGQQQRVGVARALVVDPKIIFADEPTGNLDSHTSEEVMKLMQQVVRQQKKTLVMVTHDNHLATYADRVFHISDGKIIKIENHRKNEANKEEKKNE